MIKRARYTWTLPRTSVELGDRTAIMGILNVTPDSFSDGGRYFDLEKAIARGREIEQEGADFLDIGGESTRPGSMAISEDEEIRRVMPVLEFLCAAVKIPVSIDTYRSGVARRALEAGAQIVNDISSFRFDPQMAKVVCDSGAAVVLMHSIGERTELFHRSMLADPVGRVRDDLSAAARDAIAAGIAPSSIAVDPGIGFSKQADDNVKLLHGLDGFAPLQYPLLIGTSRKSFIRSIILDLPDARLWGTAATVSAAIMQGAHIVRVHDVRPIRALAEMTDAISRG